MSKNLVSVKIAGPAGKGIKSSGQLLSKSLIAHGLNIFDYSEYPSLVRGGHNTFQVSSSSNSVYAPHSTIDIFFSVTPGHWQQHLKEFSKTSLVFSDEVFGSISSPASFLQLPLESLTQQVGNPLTANTICLGVAAYLLNLNQKLIIPLIEETYSKYSKVNIDAFTVGYEYAKINFSSYQMEIARTPKTKKTFYTDGNEAFGWGFLKGKGNFYAAYPMTPATGALHFLAEKQKEYDIAVVHPEDEIAAANMASGAAFAGARAGVGTSGGGFALMNEAVSFCGVAEIGMVYYLVSRPGPATGLPTWTAQADLLHALYSGHGEFPKVVLAPGDHQESFDFSVSALNLASRLQAPVIVVSDKFLGESFANTDNLSQAKPKVDLFDRGQDLNEFKRYSLSTKTGDSPLSLPGTPGGEFLANSYEHDEYGFSTEDPVISQSMTEKRLTKLKLALKLSPKPIFYGNTDAKKLIIAWGSTKGPILESMKLLKNPESFAFLQIRTLSPIESQIQKIIDGFKEKIIIENNQTSQLTTILKSVFDFHPTHTILKYDGRPFFPEELAEKLSSLKI